HRPSSAYSITSLAPADSASGTSRPSVLAVLRLITRSIFVTCCTGRLAGFSPLRYLDSTKSREAVVDTGGQVESGVVDDSPWIFVRSGTRRTDSGRAGWPCGAPGGAAGERDCSFERRLELRGGRVGAFAGRRHGARVVRGLSETGHGGIEEFRP